MSQHEDKSSNKPFNMVIPGLVALVIIIAIFAYDNYDGGDGSEAAYTEEEESARIAPIGAVATDADITSDQPTETPPVVVQTVIEKPPIDAETIYKTVCFACHDTGAANAPKLSAEFWTERLPKGEEVMIASALNGIGTMPPKGGRMDLSDEEVSAVVVYMISKVQE